MENNNLSPAKKIAALSVLTALIIVLQSVGGLFTIAGLSLSFVLVPIVLGAVLYGTLSGAVLGFIFSLIVFIFGITGREPFTQYLLANFTVVTVFTIFVKGTLAGVVSGLIYKVLKSKNEYVAVCVAAFAAPVVNTGVFMLGVLIMGDTVIAMLSIGVLFNFLIELAINVFLAPALYRVVKIVRK